MRAKDDSRLAGSASLKLEDPSLLRQQCYVNGAWLDAAGGGSLPVNNPATGAALGTVPAFGAAETEQAVAAAHAAFPAWAAKTAKERAVLLRRYGPQGMFLFPMPEVTARIARFEGRLLYLLDEEALGPCDPALRRRLRAEIDRRFDGKGEILGVVPAADAITVATALRRLLRRRGIPHQEVFALGASRAEAALAEVAGLALFKWIDSWFASA